VVATNGAPPSMLAISTDEAADGSPVIETWMGYCGFKDGRRAWRGKVTTARGGPPTARPFRASPKITPSTDSLALLQHVAAETDPELVHARCAVSPLTGGSTRPPGAE
jgi:hypothetical protein